MRFTPLQHLIFFFLSLFCIANILDAQETGGPFAVDDSTLLLMHFDNNLQMEGLVSGTASMSGGSTLFESSLANFSQSLRIDNSESAPGQCLVIPENELINPGNHWTLELWAKVGSYGSGKSEFPTIFIKDADGFPSILLGFDHEGNGFTSAVTMEDMTEISINQNNPVNSNAWYHLAFISDSVNKTFSFIIHDEQWNPIFRGNRSFPENGGQIYQANKEIFVGGVPGSSNIQFDGWIDELRISNCARDYSVKMPPLQLATTNFEFYTANENIDYWNTISPFLDRELIELCSYWDRPGLTPLIDENEKIKIYLLKKHELNAYAGRILPDWKRGWYDAPNKAIAIALPGDGEDYDYYGSLDALVRGTLGQLIIKLRYNREEFYYTPSYFMEGFGLYRGGYRPDRDSILVAIDELGRFPLVEDIIDTRDINLTFKKDLCVSYTEFQLFSGMAYQNISTYGYEKLWNAYIPYYYLNEEDKRMMLRRQTEHFDIYCTAQDLVYLDSIECKLEEKLAYYTDSFDMEIGNRFNCVIFPDEETGMACMGYGDHYNGGSGCGGDKLDILSPVYFSGGLDEAMLSLIPHEFFHVFHNHMSPDPSLIGGFHAEGMAEFMTYGDTTPQYLRDRAWGIRDAFSTFETKYGREPKLADFMADVDGNLSVYWFGQAFWYYMHENHADYTTIRNFFYAGCDWGVFDVSYEEIDNGYINFLKEIGGISAIAAEPGLSAPGKFVLSQNYPNPFNPVTTINYEIPRKSHVTIKVYNLLGQEIAILVDESKPGGRYSVDWNAQNMTSGIYYYKIEADNFSAVKKLTLIK